MTAPLTPEELRGTRRQTPRAVMQPRNLFEEAELFEKVAVVVLVLTPLITWLGFVFCKYQH